MIKLKIRRLEQQNAELNPIMHNAEKLSNILLTRLFIYVTYIKKFQKVTFELLMDFKQNHYGSWKVTGAASFKSFLHLI